MFAINDVVVYKRDVCKIEAIKKKLFNNEDYYILHNMFDDTVVVKVPVSNRGKNLRSTITKDEVERLINKIPDIDPIDGEIRMIENEYKSLLLTDEHEDLIKIIKSAYSRNQHRIEQNKATNSKDSQYLAQAETYLFQELSIVLGMTIDEVRQYIIDEVSKLEEKQ